LPVLIICPVLCQMIPRVFRCRYTSMTRVILQCNWWLYSHFFLPCGEKRSHIHLVPFPPPSSHRTKVLFIGWQRSFAVTPFFPLTPVSQRTVPIFVLAWIFIRSLPFRVFPDTDRSLTSPVTPFHYLDLLARYSNRWRSLPVYVRMLHVPRCFLVIYVAEVRLLHFHSLQLRLLSVFV